MLIRILPVLMSILVFQPNAVARDFEDGYAVYGAGAQACSTYLQAIKKGGKEEDFFIDWMIGYLSAFNVIMPNTYDILGETDFATSQRWLENHCRQYPRELFVNAMARLTEILYPTRYQSGLKKPPVKDNKPAKPTPALKDVSKALK
ncbi:MAG: hypothetical protein OQL06_12990 [Gammaproteobacteria bacterium]|nr:hypothetical protein [Gammaproteobacteria bacterium]